MLEHSYYNNYNETLRLVNITSTGKILKLEQSAGNIKSPGGIDGSSETTRETCINKNYDKDFIN
jgi:hypothetical protein